MTARAWCFTLNNPSEEECPKKWILEERTKLCVYQMEMGEEGTIHYQGYVEVKSPMRLAALKKWNGRVHWEKRRGRREDAMNYCAKEESRLEGPVIYDGEQWINSSTDAMNYLKSMTERGNKNCSTKLRLSTIKDKLSQGSSTIEQIADEEFDLWVRYYRAFEKYICMKTKPRNHPVDVHVLQGPTGTGKSKWALETYSGAYWKQRSNWWDGYAGHEAVVIDEFYGWLPFDLLLRICDRYPLLVETKGGQVQFVAKTIIITTNQLPSSWYKSAYFPALARRVTKWHVLPIWGFHSTYENWGDALKHMSENINVN